MDHAVRLDRAVDTPVAIKPARLYSAFWRWHFLAALIVIPFVLWQSTTGTLYLWSEWWMDVRYPELRFVPTSSAAVTPSRQIDAAFAAIGAGEKQKLENSLHEAHWHHGPPPAGAVDQPVQQIVLSDDSHRSTIIIMQGADGLPYPVFVDPHTGSVLGTLTSSQWLPGITRALHAGWPFGRPGNWLLELGDCWAIVMIVTGLYLWWPRGRSPLKALWPRFHAGPRLLLRDLHATVAVTFAGLFLFFLISALPWTSFWGGEILPRVQAVLNQQSPAGFSAGGASAAQIAESGSSIDSVARGVRERGVTGAIVIQLSTWQGSPLFVTNRTSSLSDDRIITADVSTGVISSVFRNRDLPIIPRLVAVGIHVHQGDFGPTNLWLNTLLAASLIWLSVTGIISWWIRRPKGKIGAPPKSANPLPSGIIVALCLTGVLLPIFGLSVVAVGGIRWIARRYGLKTA